jgi:hypothetical protein
MQRPQRLAFILSLAVFGSAAVTSQAGAVVTTGARQVEYVAAFASLNNTTYPYSGLLRLTIKHGIVSGTYVSTSIRPDPLDGRILPVTGTISGNQVTLNIGNAMRFNGTVRGNGRILTGSLQWRGQIYTFEAKQGWPGEGKDISGKD